jgi:hypothetical protein
MVASIHDFESCPRLSPTDLEKELQGRLEKITTSRIADITNREGSVRRATVVIWRRPEEFEVRASGDHFEANWPSLNGGPSSHFGHGVWIKCKDDVGFPEEPGLEPARNSEDGRTFSYHSGLDSAVDPKSASIKDER